MEMFVFMSGILLCLIASVAITLYLVKYVKKHQPLIAAAIMIVTMASLTALYNTVVQEYFIGKRVTYQQVCTEFSVVTLYFK